MVSVIAFVGDHGLGFQAVDKFVGKGDVVALACRADQTQRQSKGIACCVDLRAQTAAGAAQTLGIRPPFALRAPAAC